MQQTAADDRALRAVGKRVLHNHLSTCVTTAMEGGDPPVREELMQALSRAP